MTRLNQIIAVSKGAQTAYDNMITALYHKLQKTELFGGISRTYVPKDEEGEQLPAESTQVICQAEVLLAEVADTWTRLLNLTATKDWANTMATADVVVDGTTIARAVPVTYLMWLEKQLLGLHAVVTRLPTLDPARQWSLDANQGVWVTPVVQTIKSAKIPFNWVRAEATDKHPAQVDVLHKDVQVGTWSKIDSSGAIPATRKAILLARVEALQRAVKMSREAANELEVTDVDFGTPLFAYVLAT